MSSLDTFTNESLKELKNVKNNDLDDLVYRFQLTYDEIIDIIDLKYVPTKRTGYSLNVGIYEVVDLSNAIKHVLPDKVKVSVTIDNVRLKSIEKINQTLIFTEKSFFYTVSGNGIQEPILYSFALSSPPGHQIYKKPGIKLFKKINERVLSHINFINFFWKKMIANPLVFMTKR